MLTWSGIKALNNTTHVRFLVAKVIKCFAIAYQQKLPNFQNSPNAKTNARKMSKFRDLSKPRILIPVKINPYKV